MGKTRHVGADLGDDHLGGAPLHAGDRAEQLNRRRERADLLLDRVREPVDLLVEEVEVREDRADDDARARRRSGPRAPRAAPAASCAACPLASSASTAGSVVPATSASSIARPDTPRMSVATQSSLMPVSSRILCSRLASRWRSSICALAVARQVAQRADRLGRHEAGAQQPGLQQLAQPGRVGDVGLAARDLLDVAGVDEQALELVLEDRPHRLPVDAGGLHRHLRHAVRLQPVAQRQAAPARSS